MKFNDTSGKNGLIQDCERWTNLGDGTISGNSTLKAAFTALLNIQYARTLARIQMLSGAPGAEDTNYSTESFSLFDIESGQNSYQFLVDEDGNTITDITGVLIQPSDSPDFKPLDRLTLSDTDAMLVMSPNASMTGTPSGYIEKNNEVFFDVMPDYDKTEGGKLFYRLVPSYFAVADTTKSPGFVEGYHRVLSIGASLDWLAVNKAENVTLIQYLSGEFKTTSDELEAYIRQKNPTRITITGAVHSSR